MSDFRKASGWMANELRTRFVPKSRIRSGFTVVSAWLDLILILFFFLYIKSQIIIRPGIIVELPTGSFNEGVAGGPVMVVKQVDDSSGKSNVVFFDDELYRVDDPMRMNALKTALSRYVDGHNESELTIYADKRISHGTVSGLVELSRDVGLDRVNMGIASPKGDL